MEDGAGEEGVRASATCVRRYYRLKQSSSQDSWQSSFFKAQLNRADDVLRFATTVATHPNRMVQETSGHVTDTRSNLGDASVFTKDTPVYSFNHTSLAHVSTG